MLILKEGAASFNGRVVFFTNKEFRMFNFLLTNKKKKEANYEAMINYVWGARRCVVSLNTVSQLAYRVRVKLKNEGIPLTIKISQQEGSSLVSEERILILKKTRNFIGWRFYLIK